MRRRTLIKLHSCLINRHKRQGHFQPTKYTGHPLHGLGRVVEKARALAARRACKARWTTQALPQTARRCNRCCALWSAVTPAQFQALAKPEQMAFLINTYNGFTVELILTQYPKLKSIKDLGSFIQSPWKKKFFKLLGEDRHLDWIEHEQLRPNYAEPRIHAAVNCASIGCPALRDEAFTAARLDAQLEDGMKRFMSDRTRNRVANGQLEVSSIFKWFKEDFEKGHQGLNKLEDVFARFATQLTSNPAEQSRLKDRSLRITHLDYDWALNDVGR
jgi:hypothetical protein